MTAQDQLVQDVPARHAVRLTPGTRVVSLRALPPRDLAKSELLELVASIAVDPCLWSQFVDYSDSKRHFVQLHRDTHVDVWVLCWTASNDTGWHDHDTSAGAVAVAEGCLVEHNLAVGTEPLRTEVTAGAAYCFGPDHIHRLTGLALASVSIHAYSPPLWRMGQYTISPTGVLRRQSTSYADELRPVDHLR